MHVEKRQRERAEIERSLSEALHTPETQLVADEQQVERYLRARADTVYPLEYVYALLGDVRGGTVLDFGCGAGANALLLARRGARVVAVDISESLIRVARRRLDINRLAGSAQFVVGSAHDLPLRNGSVDVVLGVDILHHLDLQAAAREIHRVLKPGGRAIFKEPVRDSRVIHVIRRLIPYRARHVSPYEHPLTTPELQRFGAAFRSYSVRAFWLPFVNVIAAVPPLRRYVLAAHEWDAAILARVPALMPFTGIRVFQLIK